MKRIFLSITLLIFSVGLFAQTPKYVIYFIGDGMGIAQAYLTQQYNRLTSDGAQNLNFMNFPVRTFVSSYCANSLVTDSAAAGTALATGSKTDKGRIGTLPDDTPLVSVAEKAKRSGYGAGVVTSVGINHATPASFYGKNEDRNNYNELAEDLIAHNIDFAAGYTFLTTSKSGAKAADYVQKAKDAGIEVFCGKNEYKPVKGKRVIYLSENYEHGSSIPYAIDRQGDDQTELADFTSAAIDYLYSNYKKGFFLMVEGGEIDGAGHADDAATCVHETNDMAKSIDIALAFLAKHPNETLIVVTADHETGGLTMGIGQYALDPTFLQNQKCSKDAISRELFKLRTANEEVTWSMVKALLKEKLGFWDTVELTAAEENRLSQAYKEFFLDKVSKQEKNLYSTNESLAVVAVKILESKAQVSWSFGSHSGIVVPLFATGAKASAFMGLKDNTDIPKKIEEIAKYR